MPVLDDNRHELFAQAVSDGSTITDAYLRVYGGKRKSAEANGSRLIGNDKVKQRVQDLQAQLAAALNIKKERQIARILTIFNTPLSEVTANHELCQSYSEYTTEGGGGTTIKMPGKLDALREINKMLGFYEPEQHEHTVTGVAAATLRAWRESKRKKKKA